MDPREQALDDIKKKLKTHLIEHLNLQDVAPEQIVVAPITSEADAYGEEVTMALLSAGLRARADLRNEKISYKVREHSLAKVPVILAVGKREAEEKTVTVRRLGSQAQTVMSLDAVVAALTEEATPPDLRRG